MNNLSKMIITVIMIFIAVLVFSMQPATASVASTQYVCTIADEGYEVETKLKKVTMNKITFNANGGKIGTKKTVSINIQKGAKLKKLAATPKMSGYTFKGWYTQKSGGKKINKDTKPAKSLTYYAQWTKITQASKIVGLWKDHGSSFANNRFSLHWNDYRFQANGRFEYYIGSESTKYAGKYSVSNGKVYFTERKFYRCVSSDAEKVKAGINSPKLKYKLTHSLPDMISTYKLESDKKGNYLLITNQRFNLLYGDPKEVYSYPSKFTKS